jgi:hypothetical protein
MLNWWNDQSLGDLSQVQFAHTRKTLELNKLLESIQGLQVEKPSVEVWVGELEVL